MEFLAYLHPKVIHFPLAFLMFYPVMEMLAFVTNKDFFSKAAILFLLIGTLGAFISVFTGNQAYSLIKDWQNESLNIFISHQTFANLTMWFYTGLLSFRIYLVIKKKINKKTLILMFFLSLLGCFLVYQTGNYGGKLGKAIYNKSQSSLNNIN